MTSLKIHEHEIVNCLEKIELDTFSRKGIEIGVLPQAVKGSLESMDPAVPHSRKIRYLLLHGYDKIEDDIRLFEKWLKLLADHGVSSKVLNIIRQCLAESDSLESSKVVSLDQKFGTKFLRRHVSVLTEILASCSYKWREIRISLNLPTSVEKNIQRRMHMYEDGVCLNKVLQEWVVEDHEYAEDPTLENLENALRSELVGLGDVANMLKENLMEVGVNIQPDERAFDLSHVEKPLFDEVVWSCETEVADGKSTLLEVQASPCDATISYQWMKNGHPMHDDQYYHGTDKPVLCISNAILASNGTYSCEYQICKQHDTLLSKPIKMTVKSSPAQDILVGLYKFQHEVQKDTWQQKTNTAKNFISLALIEKEPTVAASDLFHYTIRGDVDDICRSKKGVEYLKAFGDYTSETFLLIEGRPGSGKTTLVHKISKDWANGEPILKGARFVFLISLRVIANIMDVKMLDLLNLFYRNLHEGKVHNIKEMLDETNGEGACFIFDGLDEYTCENGNSIIFDIIHKRYLSRSMVIVASRPVATANLRERANTRIETVGFQKEQIHEYVDKYPFTDSKKSEDLKLYLAQHQNILHMCYLPVHASIICFLHDMIEDYLPHTEGDIYKHFILLTLRRKITCSLKSVDELNDDSKEFFQRICKLAFDMTTSSKQVFKEDELLLSDVASSDEPALGLVTIDATAGLYGLQNQYTFVHLTFQEYLAAYYISKLNDEKLHIVMREHGGKNHMKMVWKFYCSLVSFEDQESTFKKVFMKFLSYLVNHKSKFEKIMKMYDDELFHCQCSFESQQPITCQYIGSLQRGSLNFRSAILIPSDFAAIGYVISNASSNIERLNFRTCHISDSANFSAFVNTLKLSSDFLKFLELSENGFGSKYCAILADSLKLCTGLLELWLEHNSIDDDGANSLAKSLQYCNLEVLWLNKNQIGDKGAKALSMCLMHMRELNLGENQISDDGVRDLLKYCNNLRELHLYHNQIGNGGARGLAEGLKYCTNLVLLQLDNNQIGDEGAKDVGTNLKCCSSLQELFLGFNQIGNEGTRCLGEAIKHLSHLTGLFLSFNQVGDEGARGLGDGLRCCSRLRSLNLTHNQIHDVGAMNLADGLKQCSRLEELYLSDNQIGDKGAKGLAENLKYCSNLKTFNLSSNQIVGDESKRYFDTCLKHCQTRMY